MVNWAYAVFVTEHGVNSTPFIVPLTVSVYVSPLTTEAVPDSVRTPVLQSVQLAISELPCQSSKVASIVLPVALIVTLHDAWLPVIVRVGLGPKASTSSPDIGVAA